MRGFSVEVVHSHIYACKYAQIAAVINRVKSRIHTVHSIANKEATIINQKIYRILFKHLNVIPIALSDEINQSISDLYGIETTKIPIVYNGVPLKKCNPIGVYKTKSLKFVHVGRFMKVKNHENLVKAFIRARKDNPQIELELYGEGELKGYIEEIVRSAQAEDYIYFKGITDNIFKTMNSADVFILPSFYEGMPMTLIEAMGTGLPIITTPVGGIVDMLEDGENAVFTGTDVESIAHSINLIASDSELRKTIGEAARKRSKDFSATMMARRYLEVYERGLKG